MPRKEFVKLCLDTLEQELRPQYTNDWKKLGISCDFSVFYTTINEHCQRISQRSFLDLVKKERAYRHYAPAMICPKCKTSIAQVELEDLQRESTLYYVTAKVEVDPDKFEDITFATTRPELMMACIAISVHPEDDRYKHFVGKRAIIPGSNVKVPILADESAKIDFGSGVVYWCPYGDAKDIEFVAAHPELKVKHIMNPDGRLNEQAGKYAGMNSHKAREAVVEDWRALNVITKEEPILQNVNAHERCGTPIEFVAMNQWSIKVMDLKEKWLELGEKLNWHPEHMKNRYDNWAKGLKWDWNISRQIFFGVPFPVWYCIKCEEPTFAREEDLPVDPTEDQPPTEKCEKCQSTKFIGEDDIINTWATSSLTPTIVKELFKGKRTYEFLQNNPMNLRPQGHDIISFWLFNTVVKSHLHYDMLPWNDCFVNGWMLDPKGKKMSKSKGNIIEPQKMIEKYSSDSLRFMAASCTLGEDLPFQEKELVAGKKFVNKLWNAGKFGIMHLEDYEQVQATEIFDKWILSKLHQVVKKSTETFDEYRFFHPKAETEKFFWHAFCSDYLEIVKDRLYNPEQRGADERRSAQQGIYHSLLAVLKIMSPFIPHITEEVYQLYFAQCERKKSIHISQWPDYNNYSVDKEAELTGDIGIDVINLVRKYKSDNQMSMKEEISKLILVSDEDSFKERIESISSDLKAVLRLKEVTFSGTTELETENFKVKVGIEK